MLLVLANFRFAELIAELAEGGSTFPQWRAALNLVLTSFVLVTESPDAGLHRARRLRHSLRGLFSAPF
jgi:hypothetical protein